MKILSAILLCACATFAKADPQLTSWFTLHSDQPARIYPNSAAKGADQSVTTWSNGRNTQSQLAYCGVQGILSSSNWVYIRSTGLGSQVMGPWLNGRFPNLPTDQHFIFAIPRHPTAQTSRGVNRLFEIGLFVDGVRMFDACDAFSYSHTNGRDADPRAGIGPGDRIWNRDALVNEGKTFDAALAHQQNRGTYHITSSPSLSVICSATTWILIQQQRRIGKAAARPRSIRRFSAGCRMGIRSTGLTGFPIRPIQPAPCAG